MYMSWGGGGWGAEEKVVPVRPLTLEVEEWVSTCIVAHILITSLYVYYGYLPCTFYCLVVVHMLGMLNVQICSDLILRIIQVKCMCLHILEHHIKNA